MKNRVVKRGTKAGTDETAASCHPDARARSSSQRLLPSPLELQKRAEAAVSGGRPEEALALLRPLPAESPFSPAIRHVLIAAVQRIVSFEADRGYIARTERSALASAAQPYQDLIDALFFDMAGLTGDEVKALSERYAKML